MGRRDGRLAAGWPVEAARAGSRGARTPWMAVRARTGRAGVAPVAGRIGSGRAARAGLAAVAAAACLVGCAPAAGPPPIVSGTACATCGMEVRDLRFACERAEGRAWRVYDAIECLVADPEARGAETYLADYDQQALHRADSMWVVKGEFASPMGGGLVAFLDLAAADSIAAATRGRVDRLAAFFEPAAGGVR